MGPDPMHRLLPNVLGLTLGFSVAATASADVNELFRRVPGDANAVVAVDAAHLSGAPGAGDGARPAAAAKRPSSPVPLPKVTGLQSLVLAARLHTTTMDPAWEVALMEVSEKPSMQAVALATGGYADVTSGKPAAWCGNDVYCFVIDDRTLGAVYPADRQFAARWLGAPAPAASSAPTPEYLKAAAAQVSAKTPLVIAFDLKDAVSEAGLRRTLESGRPAWAAKIPGDDKAAARLLSRVRGVTVRVGAIGADGADGVMTVDFEDDASSLAAGAKAVVTGVLTEFGLSVPDLESWEFAASGRAVMGRGRLSVTGIERLAGFLAAPGVGGPGQAAEATTAADGGDSNPSPAEASRAYYKAVSGILDSLRPGASLTESAAWLSRNARRIDQLPAPGVDPELLAWGADVSSRLREAAAILTAGQQRVRARTSSVQLSAAHVTDRRTPDNQGAAQARADRENARRQVQQAGAEERAAVAQEASKPLQAALESRGKIRAAMAERHGGGF